MLIEEVYPGIFLFKEISRLKSIKPPVNIYIISGPNGIIFDAGYGDKKTIKRLRQEINTLRLEYNKNGKPFNISRIFISHCHPDHFSGLKRLRKQLKLRIVLTKDQSHLINDKKIYQEAFNGDSYEDYLIIKKGIRGKLRSLFERLLSHFIYRVLYRMTFITHIDEVIDNETSITVNGEKWELFASPGHSSDHISLYNKEKGILISGDNVLQSITTWLGPPNSDIESYINTIKHLQNLPNLKIILPAHGSVLLNPQQRLKEILDHRNERTAQTLQIIKENSCLGCGPEDIIKALYPKANKVTREFARGWVCLTLKFLEEDNQIIRKEEKNKIRFFDRNL